MEDGQMVARETLKSCPHCDEHVYLAQDDDAWAFECSAACTYTTFIPGSKAEAIALWNRRAPDPVHEGLVRAMEAIAEMKGLTLISSDLGQPYSVGANAAFEQCADIARAALTASKSQESK
jgi:ribosomal protein S27AE